MMLKTGVPALLSGLSSFRPSLVVHLRLVGKLQWIFINRSGARLCTLDPRSDILLGTRRSGEHFRVG